MGTFLHPARAQSPPAAERPGAAPLPRSPLAAPSDPGRPWRVAGTMLLGAALGAAGLVGEYAWHGSLLMLPSYLWTTRAVPGGLAVGPAGDYSFSTADTALDWRYARTHPPGGMRAIEMIGWPGMRLTVLELPAGSPVPLAPWQAAAVIQAPFARGGFLFIGHDGRIVGDFDARGKTVRLVFEPELRDGRTADPHAILHDVWQIALSFRSLSPA